MKITMACYQAVSIIHGGPRVQILRTKQELEGASVIIANLNELINILGEKRCCITNS